jgi:hypothetical protein
VSNGFKDGEITGIIGRLQNDADAVTPSLTSTSLRCWIKAQNTYLTTIAVAETFEDFYSCGLAGAVRAKERENFTLFNGKIHAVDSVV